MRGGGLGLWLHLLRTNFAWLDRRWANGGPRLEGGSGDGLEEAAMLCLRSAHRRAALAVACVAVRRSEGLAVRGCLCRDCVAQHVASAWASMARRAVLPRASTSALYPFIMAVARLLAPPRLALAQRGAKGIPTTLPAVRGGGLRIA